MGWRQSYALFITAAVVGAIVPRPPGPSPAAAAPSDVFGNPNQAVDTYRNRAGSFVLWGDGRITRVDGGAADLGRPYADPPGSAQIGAPVMQASQALGSPNVAVKALCRPDGTYVLFADGTLKKPANSDAAAGSPSEGNVLTGSWETTVASYGIRRPMVGYDVLCGPVIEVWPDPPLSEPLSGFFVTFTTYYPQVGNIRSDSTGSHVVFDEPGGGFFFLRGATP